MPRRGASSSLVHVATTATLTTSIPGRDVIALNATVERLTVQHLSALFERRVAACHLKHFMGLDACRAVSARLLVDSSRQLHDSVPNLEVIGRPYFTARQSHAAALAYFDEGDALATRLASMAAPYASPLVALTSLLATAWAPGIERHRLRSDGRSMSPALIRIFPNGVEVLPHQDDLSQEAPGSPHAAALVDQLGLNLYLSMPDTGGELELYLEHIDPASYHRLSRGAYGLPRDTVPSPRCVIRPAVGDVVLFSSRQLHAVRRGHNGAPRITLSAFIGYTTPDAPLTIWA